MTWATVRPGKLSEALGAKLQGAAEALYELCEADKPRFTRFNSPEKSVHFLHAARGVVPIARTFTGSSFKNWLEIWETKRLLTPEQRKVWLEMHDARRYQEHGEGAGLVPHQIEITEGGQVQPFHNVALLGLAASEVDNRCWKGGLRFGTYLDRPVSEVCSEYFGLSQSFVDDFLQDHHHAEPG